MLLSSGMGGAKHGALVKGINILTAHKHVIPMGIWASGISFNSTK
jgi:hypothetical protein